jgi:hypothetical protein
MNSGLVQSAQFIGQVGNEWHIVGIGDFGGDGMSDILWRRDNGSIVAFEMNGGQVQSAQFCWCRMEDLNPRPTVYKIVERGSQGLTRHNRTVA